MRGFLYCYQPEPTLIYANSYSADSLCQRAHRHSQIPKEVARSNNDSEKKLGVLISFT
jgi:hypothetical protein